MRDFRAELAHDKCWDRATEAICQKAGAPREDAILQNREELIALCQFIEREGIRSYLEIGCWTGRLVSVLDRLFAFDRVAVCDAGHAQGLGLPLRLPFGCTYFQGSSHSEEFVQWRAALGPIDLVMIDGDHRYEGVKLDWQIQRRFAHRYLAFHDITGRHPTTLGVKRLWDELGGKKQEILRPHVELDLAETTMGIGLWAAQ